jgi:hypothetical protein
MKTRKWNELTAKERKEALNDLIAFANAPYVIKP